MAKSGRRGRPSRPYRTSWGKDIEGLYKCPDGRWRINATGQKFTEHDERRAVAKFLAMQEPDTVDSPSTVRSTSTPTGDGFTRIMLHAETPAGEFWPWLREQMITRPEYVAKMTGLPELANLRHLPLPKPPIKVDELIATYERHNPSTDRAKRRAVSTFRRLTRFADAKTLDDLTQEQLSAWREEIENDSKLASAGTRAGMYGQVKAVLSFGLKTGMDQQQIRGALDRCNVLWTGKAIPHVDPQPISREHFHRLLHAGGEPWRSWLLLALNLAMTFEDLCELRWADFDMDKGTYAAIRVKTRRDRIPRAGVLWKETIEALQDLARRSQYVFTSTHGTRYNKNSRVNLFGKLRKKAGLPDTIKMNQIRDGAYTTAARATTDERWARVLAGHRAPGLQDAYVLRNPEAVRPACDAVHKAYGPFPVTPN